MEQQQSNQVAPTIAMPLEELQEMHRQKEDALDEKAEKSRNFRASSDYLETIECALGFADACIDTTEEGISLGERIRAKLESLAKGADALLNSGKTGGQIAKHEQMLNQFDTDLKKIEKLARAAEDDETLDKLKPVQEHVRETMDRLKATKPKMIEARRQLIELAGHPAWVRPLPMPEDRPSTSSPGVQSMRSAATSSSSQLAYASPVGRASSVASTANSQLGHSQSGSLPSFSPSVSPAFGQAPSSMHSKTTPSPQPPLPGMFHGHHQGTASTAYSAPGVSVYGQYHPSSSPQMPPNAAQTTMQPPPSRPGTPVNNSNNNIPPRQGGRSYLRNRRAQTEDTGLPTAKRPKLEGADGEDASVKEERVR